MLDRFKFWKRDDPFSESAAPSPWQEPDQTGMEQQLRDLPGQEMDQSGAAGIPGQASFGGPFSQQYPQAQQYPQTQAPQEEPQITQRDVELILAKLDVIVKDLDSIHQRVRKIEQSTDTQKPQQRYW